MFRPSASYFRPRFAARTAKKLPTFFSAVDAEMIWAAAAFAYRTNGNQFFKEEARVIDEASGTVTVTHQPNKVVAMAQLRDGLATDLTDADYALGREARRFHRLTLTALSLKGPIGDFQRTVQQSAEKDVFFLDSDRLEFAVVASQIGAYIKAKNELQIREDIERGPLAAVGVKVAVDITVVRSVFSQNYGCYFITAKTDCKHMVFFSFRQALDTGVRWNAKGAVKAFRDDTTQLTRVKIGPTV